MIHRIAIIVACFISIYAAADQHSDSFIVLEQGNPEMLKAFSEARKTLPSFLEKYTLNYPNVSTYKLKVMVREKNNTEHFWVTPFRALKSGGYVGVISNEPQMVQSVEQGQMYMFELSEVTDWGYVENGKQYGSFTVCALFKDMPKEDVEYYRKNHGFQC